MATLYELKEKLATVGAELKNVSGELMDKAANPSVPIEDISAIQTKQANLQTRFDLIKAEHDRVETAMKIDLKKDGFANAKNDAERLIAAKAEFIRASILRRPVSEDALAQLQALPAPTLSGGENFLPTTLTTELIQEPFATNPLRGVIRMSNIKGLEVPKIAFTLDDDSFVGDADTAQEIEATGDKVSFNRFKFKVKVRISDTVLHGSDLDLVNTVENALRSGLAAKEKKVSFAPAISQVMGEEHMSFYQEIEGETVIKTVDGADLFEAITNAIADLHEDFRENAKVAMTYVDYVGMLKTLAGGAATLYNAQPEQIIGKPAIFSDSATVPIVGDFSYVRLNYDGAPIYDTDKDVDAGEYIWVLTAWIDQHILLTSAFRLAEVVPVG